MIRNYKQFSVLFALSILLFSACGSEENRHKVDVSEVEVNIELNRFAPKLFETPRQDFPDKIRQLRENYPELLAMYTENVIGLGRIQRDTTLILLEQFIYDQYWQKVYEEVQNQFDDLSPVQNDLIQAFKHVKYYYPKDTIPDFYTMVKGIDLRYKAVTYPSDKIALFLDLYLGPDYKYYPSQYPDYRIQEFREKYIVPDVLETYFNQKFSKGAYTDKTFLSKIIHRGKKLYYLSAMMPERQDTTIIRYDQEEWRWCQTYEGKIWNHFVENDLLYETDANKTEKFLEEGPFTNAGGIPPESPPRLGVYVGWQIIRHYMRQKPNTSLPELMKNDQYKQILNQSAYNP